MNKRRILNILFEEWRVLAGDATTFLMITVLPFAILGEGIVAIWLIGSIAGETMAANPFFQDSLAKLLSSFPSANTLPPVD